MKKIELIKQSPDDIIKELLVYSIELFGGPKKMVEYKRLTWVPSIIEALYTIYLHEEDKKNPDEIAAFLGISTNTLKNILRSSPETALKKIEEKKAIDFTDEKEVTEEIKTHIAGGIPKLVYKQWKQKQNL